MSHTCSWIRLCCGSRWIWLPVVAGCAGIWYWSHEMTTMVYTSFASSRMLMPFSSIGNIVGISAPDIHDSSMFRRLAPWTRRLVHGDIARYLDRYFLSKVKIWNVNCAQATAFIFNTRTGVLVKVSKFLRQKMYRPGVDANPNLRIHDEYSDLLSYQGQKGGFSKNMTSSSTNRPFSLSAEKSCSG